MKTIGLALLLATWACGGSTRQGGERPDLSEPRILAKAQPNRSVWRYKISPDGRAFAIVFTGQDFFDVVWHTGLTEKVDHHCELAQSADGQWIASSTWNGARATITVNGKVALELNEHVPHCAVDGRGRVAAYSLSTKGGEQLVVPGKAAQTWPQIRSIVADAEGKRVACRASQNQRDCLIEGDRVSGPFDRIVEMIYPADGGPLQALIEDDEEYFVLSGGQKGKRYEGLGVPTLASDGKTPVYWAEKKAGARVIVLGDRELEAVGKPEGAVAATADLRKIAYRTQLDKQGHVIVGTKTFGPYDNPSEPHFSADGRKVGFAAVEGGVVAWKVVAAD